MNPTCKTCRFWAKTSVESDFHPYGNCRRYPKADHLPHDDWCGEHQPREVAVEKPKVREPGLYWVRLLYREPWTTAEWVGAYWFTFGSEATYADIDLAEIDERRIERSPEA